jgi:hypothetical protein
MRMTESYGGEVVWRKSYRRANKKANPALAEIPVLPQHLERGLQ